MAARMATKPWDRVRHSLWIAGICAGRACVGAERIGIATQGLMIFVAGSAWDAGAGLMLPAGGYASMGQPRGDL